MFKAGEQLTWNREEGRKRICLGVELKHPPLARYHSSSVFLPSDGHQRRSVGADTVNIAVFCWKWGLMLITRPDIPCPALLAVAQRWLGFVLKEINTTSSRCWSIAASEAVGTIPIVWPSHCALHKAAAICEWMTFYIFAFTLNLGHYFKKKKTGGIKQEKSSEMHSRLTWMYDVSADVLFPMRYRRSYCFGRVAELESCSQNNDITQTLNTVPNAAIWNGRGTMPIQLPVKTFFFFSFCKVA